MTFAQDLIAYLRTMDEFAETDESNVESIIEIQTDPPVDKNKVSIAVNISEGIPDDTSGEEPSYYNHTAELVICGYDHPLIREKTIALRDVLDRQSGQIGNTIIMYGGLVSQRYQRQARNTPEYSASQYQFQIQNT